MNVGSLMILVVVVTVVVDVVLEEFFSVSQVTSVVSSEGIQ